MTKKEKAIQAVKRAKTYFSVSSRSAGTFGALTKECLINWINEGKFKVYKNGSVNINGYIV